MWTYTGSLPFFLVWSGSSYPLFFFPLVFFFLEADDQWWRGPPKKTENCFVAPRRTFEHFSMLVVSDGASGISRANKHVGMAKERDEIETSKQHRLIRKPTSSAKEKLTNQSSEHNNLQLFSACPKIALRSPSFHHLSQPGPSVEDFDSCIDLGMGTPEILLFTFRLYLVRVYFFLCPSQNVH